VSSEDYLSWVKCLEAKGLSDEDRSLRTSLTESDSAMTLLQQRPRMGSYVGEYRRLRTVAP